MRLWKPFAAFLFFILVLLYTKYSLMKAKEGFMSPMNIQQMIQQFQQSAGLLGKQNSYNDWIGWLYTHVQSSGEPLNDFKNRVFQPTCKFRQDWATNLPKGMVRPNPAGNKDLANVAYRSYLQCLAEGNPACLQQLDDARRRFMDSECAFLNPNPANYTKDIQQVFR
jgi:hypothetical protein